MQTNPVAALKKACGKRFGKVGENAGIIGLIGALMMLSFYTIVAGWMLAHSLSPIAQTIGTPEAANWLSSSSTLRNIIFTPIFILLTAAIVHQGVHSGIERWSSRLMPLLLIMLFGLIVYILQQDGAMEGVKTYLVPDFSRVTDANLIIAAMGQAFFSLAIGVGSMMVYGSYVSKEQKIGKLVLSIAALDTFIAFIAGLLIIPALFVALHHGQQVFEDGKLIGQGQLIFQILPSLFEQFDFIGTVLTFALFSLLSIAALTSTISATEVVVAYLVEAKSMTRKKATNSVSLVVLISSTLIILNFDALFGLVIQILTTILQPLMSLFYFVVVGWIWQRGNKITDIATTANDKKLKLFGFYLRYICPTLLVIVFINLAFYG